MTSKEVISSETLEYKIIRVGEWVIKKPKPGFEFKVKTDAKMCEFLRGIVPETYYDEEHNWLIQRYVEGRPPTEEEFERIQEEIRRRGVIPRGITKRDVIVDRTGKIWVVDVGHFEPYEETWSEFAKTKPKLWKGKLPIREEEIKRMVNEVEEKDKERIEKAEREFKEVAEKFLEMVKKIRLSEER